MAVVKVLSGHVSQETAFVVADYPYGFRLRCQMRVWLETNKRGTRMVTQTSNPKVAGLKWNKPKASTYAQFAALYLDENDHVQQWTSSMGSVDGLVRFGLQFADAMTEEEKRVLVLSIKMTQKLNAHYAKQYAEVEVTSTLERAS